MLDALKKYRTPILLATFAVVAVAIITLVTAFGKGSKKTSHLSCFAMDTAVTVSMTGGDAQGCIDLIKELDKSLNAFDENSDLYKLNHTGSITSAVLADILNRALPICNEEKSIALSCGRLIELWDITNEPATIPDEQEIALALATIDDSLITVNGDSVSVSGDGYLNFGCCAKGYACDIIAEHLEGDNADYAVVSFGSSVLLWGKRADGKPFKVSVTNPFDTTSTACCIQTDEAFVSTSGSYERYAQIGDERLSHILDLETGCPTSSDLASVTVICDSGVLSDLMSTAIYLGGLHSLGEYLKRDDIAVVAIDNDRNIYVSGGDAVKICEVQEGFNVRN